jgi:BirA family biotin operon repressor/biotin-[acetyl-CoA-carboxylase] ligase
LTGTVPNSGIFAPTQWPAEAIWEAVSPFLPQFTVEVVPEIDSTNTELMRRARRGQVDPVLLVAGHQTAGRGRLGREWLGGDSVGGGNMLPSLLFSLGMPLAPQDWSGLSLAVGLSVVESLHPALQLKWPNDVWLHARKMAGILIETASVGDVRYAVIGVGINIVPRDGEGLSTPPASLSELLPGVTAPSVLARVVEPLARAVRNFESDGFASLRSRFHGRDFLYGKPVQCSDGLTGIARGVDEGGALLVHTENGLKKISSAEVSVRPMTPVNPS